MAEAGGQFAEKTGNKNADSNMHGYKHDIQRPLMAIQVVKFSSEGYKIGKIFA